VLLHPYELDTRITRKNFWEAESAVHVVLGVTKLAACNIAVVLAHTRSIASPAILLLLPVLTEERTIDATDLAHAALNVVLAKKMRAAYTTSVNVKFVLTNASASAWNAVPLTVAMLAYLGSSTTFLFGAMPLHDAVLADRHTAAWTAF
jgi:hypothetical protein